MFVYITQVKTAGLSEEVTVLAPGHMTPAGPSSLATTQTTAKSKRKRTKSIDVCCTAFYVARC